MRSRSSTAGSGRSSAQASRSDGSSAAVNETTSSHSGPESGTGAVRAMGSSMMPNSASRSRSHSAALDGDGSVPASHWPVRGVASTVRTARSWLDVTAMSASTSATARVSRLVIVCDCPVPGGPSSTKLRPATASPMAASCEASAATGQGLRPATGHPPPLRNRPSRHRASPWSHGTRWARSVGSMRPRWR